MTSLRARVLELEAEIARLTRPPKRGRPFKLSPSQVAEARRLHEAGENWPSLGRRYGVSWRTVRRYLKER